MFVSNKDKTRKEILKMTLLIKLTDVMFNDSFPISYKLINIVFIKTFVFRSKKIANFNFNFLFILKPNYFVLLFRIINGKKIILGWRYTEKECRM